MRCYDKNLGNRGGDQGKGTLGKARIPSRGLDLARRSLKGAGGDLSRSGEGGDLHETVSYKEPLA